MRLIGDGCRFSADASRTPRGRARKRCPGYLTSNLLFCTERGDAWSLFGGSGTGGLVNTRTTPRPRLIKSGREPADGCAYAPLSVFKPARLKSGALYNTRYSAVTDVPGESVVGTSAVKRCTPRLGRSSRELPPAFPSDRTPERRRLANAYREAWQARQFHYS